MSFPKNTYFTPEGTHSLDNDKMDLIEIDTYKLSMEIFISSKEFLEEIELSSIESRKIFRSIW